jgi:hypothetical protein
MMLHCSGVDRERGSSLILIIGVVAALAVLAAALVILTMNVLHNTARHTTQARTFNIAEAALDAGQAAAWVNWPSEDTTPTLPGDFAAKFPGSSLTVTYYDDDNSGDPSPEMVMDDHGDVNGNSLMWIVAEADSGGRKAKVMALVEKITYTVTLKEGVALYTDSNGIFKGTGNQPVMGVDPPSTSAVAYVRGTINQNGQSDISNITMNPDTTTTMSTVFPDEILAALIEKSKGDGKYFTNAAAIPSNIWATDPRVVVVENGDVDLKHIPNTDTDANGADSIWSANHPGILIVLNGNVECSGQKKTLYGIVYILGGVLLTGNAEIHGMVVAKGVVDLRGTRAVNYNQDVISNLNKPVIQSVRIRPGTWRELNAGN